MLQPVELQDVSRRFAREIAGLRKFLSLASVPLDNTRSMHALAGRIAQDAAFHRDLTSHIWVLLDEGESKIQQADLLAMVANAACGPEIAATTQEQDALQLLRFLMEAKHTLERGSSALKHAAMPQSQPDVPEPASVAVSPIVPKRPAEAQHRPEPQLLDAAVAAATPALQARDRTKPGATGAQRKRLLCVSAGACTLAVLFTLAGVLRHSTKPEMIHTGVAPDSVSRQQANPRQSIPTESEGTGEIGTGPASNAIGAVVRQRHDPPAYALPPIVKQFDSSATLPPRVKPGGNQGAPDVVGAAAPMTAAAMSGSNGTTSLTANNLPRVIASPSNPTSRPRSGSATPVAVPPDILSKRLDSPAIPAYAAGADDTGRKYPRLRRRSAPPGAENTGADPALTAELRAQDLAAATSRNAKSGSPVRGVVRSACLGMMASNLIYSPTPAYPAAAAIAHVQGEVRIQANIDRDGNINSARVISGPPLLRDAAMDAVQRWRYRPFLTGGKPSPTGATAVVDFELQ